MLIGSEYQLRIETGALIIALQLGPSQATMSHILRRAGLGGVPRKTCASGNETNWYRDGPRLLLQREFFSA